MIFKRDAVRAFSVHPTGTGEGSRRQINHNDGQNSLYSLLRSPAPEWPRLQSVRLEAPIKSAKSVEQTRAQNCKSSTLSRCGTLLVATLSAAPASADGHTTLPRSSFFPLCRNSERFAPCQPAISFRSRSRPPWLLGELFTHSGQETDTLLSPCTSCCSA